MDSARAIQKNMKVDMKYTERRNKMERRKQ